MRYYDLEDRTLKFSVDLVKILKKFPNDIINSKIISQLTASGTSIGANYMEAIGAESKKDFRHKIYISLKEAKETRYWLKILKEVSLSFQNEIKSLLQESHELVLIFSKIISNTNTK